MKHHYCLLALAFISCADNSEPPQHAPDLQAAVDQGADQPKRDYRSWEPGTCWPPCGGTQYCHLTEGCDQQGPGVCMDRPRTCSAFDTPVCGCNDETYDNDCIAHTAGINIRSLGECGSENDAAAPADAGPG